MAGTVTGGKAAAATNIARHGQDYYATIGRKGGMNGHTGGFYANRQLASICGQYGGSISRKGPYKLSYRQKREIQNFYKKLLAIHLKAQRERQRQAAHAGV